MHVKMKGINILLVILLGWALSSCTHPPKKPDGGTSKGILYTCSMHPQIVRERPGACPICGMTLVQKSGLQAAPLSTVRHTVLEPVNSSVISDVSAIVPQSRDRKQVTHADGILGYDERTIYSIASRYSGRIEKIYLTYGFQEVEKGQRILDIYSPELVTAQEDLLYTAHHSSGDPSLVQAAREKLLLLGMTSAQLYQLLRLQKPFYSLPVYSPYTGHVHSSMAGNTSTEVPAASPSDVTSPNLELKEGHYILKGQVLFKVVDPAHLWALFKIDRTAIASVRVNEPMEISSPDLPGKLIKAQVDFIEPALEPDAFNTTIRVYLTNPGHTLKVNSLLHADIQTGSRKGLWVPRIAVYNLGRLSIVWLKQGGSFVARPVSTGLQTDAEIEILHGLSPSDSIARSAQYMIDSESFLHTTKNDH